MSLDHRRLMQLYDGELSAEETSELLAQVAEDEQAQAVLGGVEQLGDYLRALPLPDLDIADEVMAKVEDEPAIERANVQIHPAWRRAAPVAAAVLAMAAAVALWMRAGPTPTTAPLAVNSTPVALSPPAESGSVQQAVAASQHEAPEVAIEAVDFGGRNGSIFMVSAGEESTPVVWLVDEPTPGSGRIEPL